MPASVHPSGVVGSVTVHDTPDGIGPTVSESAPSPLTSKVSDSLKPLVQFTCTVNTGVVPVGSPAATFVHHQRAGRGGRS